MTEPNTRVFIDGKEIARILLKNLEWEDIIGSVIRGEQGGGGVLLAEGKKIAPFEQDFDSAEITLQAEVSGRIGELFADRDGNIEQNGKFYLRIKDVKILALSKTTKKKPLTQTGNEL